jgi:pimeloyl-ACP methyl ester carboxylesterase
MRTTAVESFVVANGLSHHVLTWDGRAANATGSELPTVVLLHGWLDIAWSFEALGSALAAAGRRAVAFDFRGHGETQWVPTGGYYHFPDYLLDLDALLPALAPGEDVIDLFAHSMGGTVAMLFTGARPQRVRRLVLAEGLGPPDMGPEALLDRTVSFLDGVARTRQTTQRPVASIADALARMRIQNPELPEELGLFLAEKSTAASGQDGARVWRFDPLHRTRSPSVFRLDQLRPFLARIKLPVLAIAGERGYRLGDEVSRLALLADARIVEIAGAGHMMHWTHPDAVAAAVVHFLT